MARLTLTWFSGLFGGVAILGFDPMVQLQAGFVAGVFYLLAWLVSHD